MNRLLYLAIHRIPFLRPGEKLRLAETLEDENELLSLRRFELEAIINRKIRSQRWDIEEALRLAERDEKLLTRGLFDCTFYWDQDYPALLRQIYDPPFLLFRMGESPPRDPSYVAVVGTRRASGGCRKAAFSLGLDLGRLGVPVVSGLAMGIDGAAHLGNVKGGGPSIAVFGCGIDRVYPKSNRGIGAKIIQAGGCFLSEYPPGMAPLRHHFPCRNRIISGLARTIVVVEAPHKSGALITADYALEQGRELCVHTMGVNSLCGAGTARLAEEGATIVSRGEEIVDEWAALREYRGIGAPAGAAADEAAAVEIANGATIRIDEKQRHRWGDKSLGESAELLEAELVGNLQRFQGEYFR